VTKGRNRGANRFIWIAVALGVLGASATIAQEEDGFRHLPRQMNNSSCQSYALGLAVHYEDRGESFSFDQTSEELFFDDIRDAEAKIRTLVEFAKGEEHVSHRGHWKQAIREYSGVNGQPKYQVRENISSAAQTLPQFQGALLKHFASNCSEVDECPITRHGNTEGVTPRPLIVSITGVHGLPYKSSHVVLVKDVRPKGGYDGRSSHLPSRMEYLVENSASRRTDMTCGKSGSREWVSNIDFNTFGGLGYVLTWIEPRE